MSKKVLVIGATGLIGQAVAKQFKTDGFDVRVLTRNLEKAKAIFNEDYEIAEGDVLIPESLEKAFEGVKAVYINLPEQNVSEAMKHIIVQSKKSGIIQIGYTSGSSVRKENAWHPMIRGHYNAENQIIESGIPYSIFRPTMILDTLPRYANNGKPFIIGNQPQKWSWIYSEDLAKMVSKAFQIAEAKNKKFTVFGPDKFTIPGAIDLFNAEFNPNAKKAKATPYWMANLMALFIGSKFKYIISLFKYFETHPEEGDPMEANTLLGKPQTGLKEFFEIFKSRMTQNNKS